MTDLKINLWVTETHKGITALSFRIRRTLFSEQSPYQAVDVVETAGHGRMLLNDGLVMLSERDEFIYHEMISHVPLFAHPDPKNVLIIGGGDGGTAREVLKHKNIEKVVMVEIDKAVVDACRKHIPSVASSFDDPRLELIIADGVAFAKKTTMNFDIAIIDSTDPIGPAEPLFNEAFYASIARLLTEDGIMVTQAESPFYDTETQVDMLKRQKPYFKRLHLYLFPTLTYPGGLWSFGFASKNPQPAMNIDSKRVRNSGIVTKYYTPAIHKAAFVLPPFIEKNLKGIVDPVEGI